MYITVYQGGQPPFLFFYCLIVSFKKTRYCIWYFLNWCCQELFWCDFCGYKSISKHIYGANFITTKLFSAGMCRFKLVTFVDSFYVCIIFSIFFLLLTADVLFDWSLCCLCFFSFLPLNFAEQLNAISHKLKLYGLKNSSGIIIKKTIKNQKHNSFGNCLLHSMQFTR